MKCEYEGCKAEAKFRFGLADPDAEGSFYCEGHVEQRKREISFELFIGESRCKAITGEGRKCLNSKKYGEYCGLHKNYSAR